MQFKTLTYQSSTIFYRVTGKGKPVILIHGFGEDGSVWDNQVNFLKDHFRLIIPDIPGSGKSGIIPDMSIEGISELIKEILDIEVFKAFSLSGDLMGAFGHSMGGYITLAFAEKYPNLLSSFGLIHSSAFADSEEKKAARYKSIEFIKNHGSYEFLRTIIPGLFLKGQDGSKPSDPYINELMEKGKQFSSEALIQYYMAMIGRKDRTEVLKKFEKPILFIIGEHDNAVPFEQSLKQCHLPIQSYLHILRKSAHMGMLEEPAKTNNILLQFLQ